MPRIPEAFADCSIYLYSSETAAKRGQDAGGSGFLVHVTASDPRRCHVYAVTNRHLIEDGFCVLRLNRKGGDTDTISTKSGDWFTHPDGDDVAVYPLDILDGFKWSSIPADYFADRESLEIYNLGYGDDVFMVGRLIVQSGRQKNTPVVRFGNISLSADPAEPVKYGGREQEAFLIECRSISGFSGSPVFVQADRWYRQPQSQKVYEFRKKRHPFLNEDAPPQNTTGGPLNLALMPWAFTVGPLLLGIDFGHLPIWNNVYLKARKTDYQAQSNTGIAGVVPSWKIMDILNLPKLAEDREMEDEKLRAKLTESTETFVPDAAHEHEELVFTQQDFEADLRKVTRQVEPSESDEGKK